MSKESAIKFLKKLHTLESVYSTNLLTQNEKELVEALRDDFLKAWRGEL